VSTDDHKILRQRSRSVKQSRRRTGLDEDSSGLLAFSSKEISTYQARLGHSAPVLRKTDSNGAAVASRITHSDIHSNRSKTSFPLPDQIPKGVCMEMSRRAAPRLPPNSPDAISKSWLTFDIAGSFACLKDGRSSYGSGSPVDLRVSVLLRSSVSPPSCGCSIDPWSTYQTSP